MTKFMKQLYKNWRKYLTESNDRGTFKCPTKDPYGLKTYYKIDRNNPPRIEDILSCWAKNAGHIYDSNVNHMKPAIYPTEELIPFREYTQDQLRNQVDSERYQELKDNMEAEGIKEPLIVYLGKNGVAKIGEGNHRHEIALELEMPEVPVRFIFWEKVYLSEDAKDETPT